MQCISDYRPGDEKIVGSPYYEDPCEDAAEAAFEEAIRDPEQIVDALYDLVMAGPAKPIPSVDGKLDTYKVNAASLLVGLCNEMSGGRAACAAALVNLICLALSEKAAAKSTA